MNSKIDRFLTKEELAIVKRDYESKKYLDGQADELNRAIILNPTLMPPKNARADIDAVIKIMNFFNDSLFNNIVGVDSDKIKTSDFRDFEKEWNLWQEYYKIITFFYPYPSELTKATEVLIINGVNVNALNKAERDWLIAEQFYKHSRHLASFIDDQGKIK